MEEGTTDRKMVTRARVIVGELLWMTSKASPDVAHAVSRLSIVSHKPSKLFWQACQWLLGYLLGRKGAGIRYTKRRKGDPVVPDLTGISDASFAAVRPFRSHIGFMLFVGKVLVDWKCAISKMTCTSTTHSECIAMSECSKSMLRLGGMMSQMGLPAQKEICTDSMSQFQLSVGGVSKRTAHIQYRHRAIKDLVAAGFCRAAHVPGKVLPADCLTKNMRVVKQFRLLRRIIMEVDHDDDEVGNYDFVVGVDLTDTTRHQINLLNQEIQREELVLRLYEQEEKSFGYLHVG